MFDVSVVKYEKPMESMKKAIELAGGIGKLSSDSKVVLKPNLVVWHEGINFPKYAVLTTSRMMEDMVMFLSDHGVKDISIVEGCVEFDKNPKHSVFAKEANGLC